MKARDVMSSPVITVRPDTLVAAAAALWCHMVTPLRRLWRTVG